MDITLSYGGGGEETNSLIHNLFYKHFSNEILESAEDAAILSMDNKIAFTTDSFTISPLFFNGGDIGKLSIVGTCNDLAMMGAKPKYLSCSFIIEEGLSYELLEKIVLSQKKELEKIGAKIVCGDTKVVPKGTCDKIFINTTGIGQVIKDGISAHNLQDGDVILVSRDIAKHGAVVMAHRYNITTNIQSDCKLLYEEIAKLIHHDIHIKAIRDATRGGISAVLNEWSKASNVKIEIEEQNLPIDDDVIGLCEIFGFEPMDLANEGTFVIAIAKDDAPKALNILQEFNKNASIIGKVTKGEKVVLKSPYGSQRYIDLPKGELLPRIC
ncbi:MAG: hydrogenase expression/formation protein HypE, partial [Epsilonproteobacteria bacterium]|nr:hydrogenase expression/formation protein HypE [Campylobacterota bacterium]